MKSPMGEKNPWMALTTPEKKPPIGSQAAVAMSEAVWKATPMASSTGPRSVSAPATASIATPSTETSTETTGDRMSHTTDSAAPTMPSAPHSAETAPWMTGSTEEPRLSSDGMSGSRTGPTFAMAPSTSPESVSPSGDSAPESQSSAPPSPSTVEVTPPITAEPSGSRAASAPFWMSFHFSGQSSVASMVPMMSPWAPRALWPRSSMLMAPLLSAATNWVAFLVPKMSLAALMAAASSPALTYPSMAETESEKVFWTSPPLSATEERAFFIDPSTDEELRPALSSCPAMSATSSRLKPSSCMAGPLDCTTETRSLNPIPVCWETPKR